MWFGLIRVRVYSQDLPRPLIQFAMFVPLDHTHQMQASFERGADSRAVGVNLKCSGHRDLFWFSRQAALRGINGVMPSPQVQPIPISVGTV
jgi:hypothetical protein